MGTTRSREPDPARPHATSRPSRSAYFVVNPFVSHIRRNFASAIDFALERFKEHRVMAIGEQHASLFVAPTAENGCVRMFLRDLVRALHADADCRLRYLVVEFDEEAMRAAQGPWEQMEVPPGTVNPKAHWFASYLVSSTALREVFVAIAREIPSSELEVVGIDHRVGPLAMDAAEEWIFAEDLERGETETPAEFSARRLRVTAERGEQLRVATNEREEVATRRFEERVLGPLGDDRALVYYGSDHLREGRPAATDVGFTEHTFVRRLIRRDNGLSADDIYAVATLYPGSMRRNVSLDGPDNVLYGRRGNEPQIALARAFDVLRAEFPDAPNLGFDVDEARFALLPIDRDTEYALGERFDGCFYFRDLNRWDGHTAPPDEAEASPASPPLSITSTIPSLSWPGNTIFVYGYVLTEDTEVLVEVPSPGGRPAEQFPCTDVVFVNENLIQATVPFPGRLRPNGTSVNVIVRRPFRLGLFGESSESGSGSGGAQSYESAKLLGAFRYRFG
ncbi:MAG: hypothetical protein AAF799_00940 [Myxococcota bacterium]